MTEKSEIDLDLILTKIGDFGKYQILYYTILCIPTFLVGGTALTYIFTAGHLDYRCRIDLCEQEPATYDMPWLKNAIPYKNSAYSKCSHFALLDNVTDALECSNDIFNKSLEIKCNSSMLVYFDDEVTIVNELDVTCEENEWKLALVVTLNSVASFACLPVIGYFSDRLGRKVMLMFSLVSAIIFGLLRSFSTNYWMFVSFEMLDVGLSMANFQVVFIYGMEILSPRRRVLGATIISTVYTFGLAYLGVIAMVTRHFRTMLQIIYAPLIITMSLFWILPESMRWLNSKGRHTEVIEIIKKIAKMNKIELEKDLLRVNYENKNKVSDGSVETPESVKLDEENKLSTCETFLTILKTPFLLIRLLNSCFCWLTNNLVYYGLSLNSVNLAGDKYVNYILSCLIEIPGSLLCLIILDRYGRRWSLCISLLISGIACILSEFLLVTDTVILILFLVGKCAIAFSFSTIYIYTTEYFPTNLRHSLMAVSAMFGSIGSMIAPLIPLMGVSPFLLFGCAALVAGGLALIFPETLNRKLPDTIEEAKDMKAME